MTTVIYVDTRNELVEDGNIGQLPAYPKAERLIRKIRFLLGGSRITDRCNEHWRSPYMGRRGQYGFWYEFTSRSGAKVNLSNLIQFDCGGRWGGSLGPANGHESLRYGDKVEIRLTSRKPIEWYGGFDELSAAELVELDFVLEAILGKRAEGWVAYIKEANFQADVARWQRENPDRTY